MQATQKSYSVYHQQYIKSLNTFLQYNFLNLRCPVNLLIVNLVPLPCTTATIALRLLMYSAMKVGVDHSTRTIIHYVDLHLFSSMLDVFLFELLPEMIKYNFG